MSNSISAERIAVARRLRDNADDGAEWIIPWAAFNDAQEHDNIALNNRLADLIDPTCEIEPAGKVPKKVADNLNTWLCSECGSPIYNDMMPTYCPYCGARVVNADE
ncbi:hypothetical protein [uncultured Olegusella sp.]|uniref:hypothetical protein n=1 Tax=uncultured Olegusella sp. TaxID=1979846 RepID=UPI002630D0D0|nr:hypothetical protein [uncultured Olegusella sp.]